MFDFTLKDDSENTLQKCGVYKITCTTNGKFYIGSTSQSFRIRFTGHRKDLRSDNHHSKYFQNCYNKYTEASFKLEVLEVMYKTVDNFKTLLLDREQFHMDENLPELNMYPSARSCLGFKRDDDFCNKIRDAAISRFTSNTGESNIYWYNDRFIVDVRHKRVGSFTNLEEAVKARDHYLNTKETYKKPSKSNQRNITSQDSGWTVLVKGKYVGFYQELADAIQARDEFIALPPELQIAKKRNPSNTGHTNIQYRKSRDCYRVLFGDIEVCGSCKTLEEAIQIKERYLATGEKPPSKMSGTGYDYVIKTANGRYAFRYKKKQFGTHSTLEEAVAARDHYFVTQNESVDCGSNSATTSTTGSSTNNPKSSSDTQSS